MRISRIAIAMLAACGARVDGGPDGGRDRRDAAAPATNDPDAGSGVATDAIDAPAGAARVVFLDFDGVTLARGPSDATTNTAAWLHGGSSGTAPRYRDGLATRSLDVATIFDGVSQRLAGIATVTKTRPASGDYVMIVLGGKADAVRSPDELAAGELDCGDAHPNDVAWIADAVLPTVAVDTTIGAIGFGLGLSAVNDPSDCMCGWGDACIRDLDACVTHDHATRDTAVANDPNAGTPLICPGATQDEVTVIAAAF